RPSVHPCTLCSIVFARVLARARLSEHLIGDADALIVVEAFDEGSYGITRPGVAVAPSFLTVMNDRRDLLLAAARTSELRRFGLGEFRFHALIALEHGARLILVRLNAVEALSPVGCLSVRGETTRVHQLRQQLCRLRLLLEHIPVADAVGDREWCPSAD